MHTCETSVCVFTRECACISIYTRYTRVLACAFAVYDLCERVVVCTWLAISFAWD